MKRLDFGFLKYDDLLEARTDTGFYHLIPHKDDFRVTLNDGEYHLIGDFPNIYDALDAANKHYNESINGKVD